MSTALLRVSRLTKTFPGLRALDDVSFEIRSGEILAVVGQNGSGKSTLVKILAGLYQPDAGAFHVVDEDGTTLTGAAATAELHFIHQDLGLVPTLNTVENLDLGHELGRRGFLPAKRSAEQRRAIELIARFGISFDVTMPISRLSAAERTIVAIARALDGWTRPGNVLVLDEPTAALAGDEVGRLFEAVRRVAAAGAGIIFISHRLDEVMDLADRVIALRDGRVVADVESGQFDHEALVRMIAGRKLSEARVERETCLGETVLAVRHLAGATIHRIDFELRAGEVLGITGLLGSGREHVSSVIFGGLPRVSGEVTVSGKPLAAGSPRHAVEHGVGLVPADRRTDGVVMDHSVRENLTLPRLAPLRRAMWRLDRRAEQHETRNWMDNVGLRPRTPERPVKFFSGGNQQKVVLAKWLRNEPAVLLLDEPTQGVDVGAKASIYKLIASAAERGAGVLVSSSDTKELTMLCDRVLVMCGGVVTAELDHASLSEERLVRESLGLPGDTAGVLAGATSEQSHA
jgi:ABC-type sugar transport system ATPase subunit